MMADRKTPPSRLRVMVLRVMVLPSRLMVMVLTIPTYGYGTYHPDLGLWHPHRHALPSRLRVMVLPSRLRVMVLPSELIRVFGNNKFYVFQKE